MIIYQMALALPSFKHKNAQDRYSFASSENEEYGKINGWFKHRFKYLGDFNEGTAQV